MQTQQGPEAAIPGLLLPPPLSVPARGTGKLPPKKRSRALPHLIDDHVCRMEKVVTMGPQPRRHGDLLADEHVVQCGLNGTSRIREPDSNE